MNIAQVQCIPQSHGRGGSPADLELADNRLFKKVNPRFLYLGSGSWKNFMVFCVAFTWIKGNCLLSQDGEEYFGNILRTSVHPL